MKTDATIPNYEILKAPCNVCDSGPVLQMKKCDTLPFGRAILHRKTGVPAGPISPLFAEDWPYRSIPDKEVLWRYLDFFKFVDMLETSTLYLARPDSFDDPFEGRFSPANRHSMSKSEAAFREHYKISNSDERDYVEMHRKMVFILCWHRNTRESRQMWSAYTKSSDSVVITTSAKAIRVFTPATLMKSSVKYSSLDEPRTRFGHSSLFFYKPSGYAFEREFRVLRSPDENEAFHQESIEDGYRRIPIRLRRIVHRVILHPEAPTETIRKASELLNLHLPGVSLERSALANRRISQ